MTGKRKRLLAVMLSAGLLAGHCGCAANRTPDKSTKDVSGREKEEQVLNRNWFCTAKDMYYDSEDWNRIVQRSFTGDTMREYKVEDGYLLSVKDDWLYYFSGEDVFRAPIRHESGADWLDVENSEKLLPGSKKDGQRYVVVMDSGLIYQSEWEEAKILYYDFASKKKRACMEDLLSDPDKIDSIELISSFGDYAIITVSFFDKKATFGSVYRTYRYDVKQDKAELLPESTALRTNYRDGIQMGESYIIDTCENDLETAPRLVQYDIKENTIKTLLTQDQFDKLFQQDIQPGISQEEICFAVFDAVFPKDEKEIFAQYEVLWHKGTEYHMRNYIVSVSLEDGSVRYEELLSEAMANAVKPRKLLWKNNYEAKTDCPFFAHESCLYSVGDIFYKKQPLYPRKLY